MTKWRLYWKNLTIVCVYKMGIAKGKLSGVIQHCIYEISTGKWKPGEKLPSVRSGEKLWNVNRLTVLSAYKELAKMGIVASEDRRGYFVAENKAYQKNVDEKDTLDQLYLKVLKLLKKETSFDPMGVFRYFSTLAERDAEKEPKIAFLECSQHQSNGHVAEIKNRLNLRVEPMLIEENINFPATIETLLTTGFHIQEVSEIGKQNKLKVVNVPIEVDPDIFKNAQDISSATIFELEESMSRDIFNDVKVLAGDIELSEKVVADINMEIEKHLNTHKDELIFLSPRVWGRTQKKWQSNPKVRLIRFRITPDSWQHIAKATNLPFHQTY